jgi:hypothetical protein
MEQQEEESVYLPVLGHPAPFVDTGSSFYLFMVKLDTQRSII